MDRSPVDRSATSPVYIPVVCPLCQTRMHATDDRVGQKIVCPDCHTKVLVPRPPKPVFKKVHLPDVRYHGEDYELLEGVDQPSADDPIVHRNYILIVCPQCQTRLHSTEDQVGQEIVCPDCHTKVIVPRSPNPLSKKVHFPDKRHQGGDYEVLESVDQPSADDPIVHRNYIPVVCPHCQTRMHSTEDQVGQEIVCPDCQTQSIVPPPPTQKRKSPLVEISDEPLEVCDPIERPPQELFGYDDEDDEKDEISPSPPTDDDPTSQHSRLDEPSYVRPDPPRWPFLTGILSFPFYAGTWSRWLTLSFVLAVVLLLAEAVVLASAGASKEWAISLMYTVFAVFIGVIWAVSSSAHGLAIIQSTADGNDDVVSWPDALWIDWILECFYIINSLSLSAIAGLGFARALAALGQPAGAAVPVVMVILFPMLLLSMMEANSAFMPISWPIWRSIFATWWAWLLFYLETTTLVTTVAWITWLIYSWAGPFALIAVAPLLMATLLIYFRILGRLAWYCAERAAAADAVAEEAADGHGSMGEEHGRSGEKEIGNNDFP